MRAHTRSPWSESRSADSAPQRLAHGTRKFQRSGQGQVCVDCDRIPGRSGRTTTVDNGAGGRRRRACSSDAVSGRRTILAGATIFDVRREQSRGELSEDAVRRRIDRTPDRSRYFTSPAELIVSRLMSQFCPTATSCFSSFVWS